MNDFNLGLFILCIFMCCVFITWITKLRRENKTKDQKLLDKDEEISIKDQAIEYQKEIINKFSKYNSNGKHG